MGESTDVLILGAGLTGLAAGTQLGNRAVLVEAEEEPGGLARSFRVDGWWFDRVLHLLYFQDDKTERVVKNLLGETLCPCSPCAYVEALSGTTLYPFQMNLSTLPKDVVVECLADLAAKSFSEAVDSPGNFAEALSSTFGDGMCKHFLYPYNRKMWKRPLDALSSSHFAWTITRPDFRKVLNGAFNNGGAFESYNAHGQYPRPPLGAPSRGMSVLSMALAAQVADLRYSSLVTAIHPTERIVAIRQHGEETLLRWNAQCLSTLPLPLVLKYCSNLPQALADKITQLNSNRVAMVYLGIRGLPPDNFGHWRYYADESICFNRLISMNQFDEHAAPEGGWSLMAEITQISEEVPPNRQVLIDQVIKDARRTGAIAPTHRIEVTHANFVDPAYVVFSPSNQSVMQEARDWLRSQSIFPLGRYGFWEYSSMAQCMRDGFQWGRAMADQLGHVASPGLCWGERRTDQK